MNYRPLVKTAVWMIIGAAVALAVGRLLHRRASSRVIAEARKLADQQDQYRDALRLFEVHFDSNPGSETDLLQYASLLTRVPDSSSVRKLAEVYRSVLERNPDSPDALRGLTRLSLGAAARNVRLSSDGANEWSQAAELARRLTEVEPQAIDGHEYLARAYIGLGQLTEAEKVLEKLTSDHPDAENAYFLLAQVAQQQERSADEVRAPVLAALTKNPTSWSAHLRAHAFFAAREETDDAEKALQRALDLGPDEPGVLFVAALEAERSGGLAEASQRWQKLRDTRKDLYHPYVAAARIAARRGEFEVAAKALLDGLGNCSHGKPELLFRLASLHLDRGRLAAAGEYLEALRGIAPGSMQVALLDGQRVMFQGRLDEARGHLERARRALERMASHLPPLSEAKRMVGQRYLMMLDCDEVLTKSYMLLGRCYAGLGENGAAANIFHRVLGRRPGWVNARVRFAECLIGAGDVLPGAGEAALAARIAASQKNPDPEAWLTWSRALLAMSKSNTKRDESIVQAIRYCEQLPKDSVSAEHLLALAELHLARGEHDEAEGVLKRNPAKAQDLLRLRSGLVRYYMTRKPPRMADARNALQSALKETGPCLELATLSSLLLDPDEAKDPKERYQKAEGRLKEALAEVTAHELIQIRSRFDGKSLSQQGDEVAHRVSGDGVAAQLLSPSGGTSGLLLPRTVVESMVNGPSGLGHEVDTTGPKDPPSPSHDGREQAAVQRKKLIEEAVSDLESTVARCRAELASFYIAQRASKEALGQLNAFAESGFPGGTARPFFSWLGCLFLDVALETGDVEQAKSIISMLRKIDGPASTAVVCAQAELSLQTASDADAPRVAKELARKLESLLREGTSWRAWSLLGDIRRREGNLVTAVDCYQSAYRANPRSIRAGLQLLRALNAAERYREAAVIAERLAAANPSSSAMLRLSVSQLARGGEYEKAMGLLEGRLEADPLNTSVLLTLADLCLATGALDKAGEHLSGAFDAAAKSTDQKQKKAAQLRILQRLQLVYRQQDKKSKSLEACNQFVESFPEDPDPYFLRARHYRAWRDFGAASSDLERAMTLSDEGNKARNLIMLTRGDVAMEKGDLKEALSWYRRAAKLEPPGRYARKYFIERLIATGRQDCLEEATKLTDGLLKEAPDDPHLHLFRARLYALDPDTIERAIHHCQRASALAPQMPQPYHQLSMIYEGRGNLGKATDEASRAFTREPSELDALLRYARLLKLRGRHAEASSLLDDAVRRFPDNVTVVLARASLVAVRQDATAAAEVVKAALAPNDSAKEPTQARLHASLAYYLELAGDVAQAERHLELACSIDGKAASPVISLAKFLTRHGKQNEAHDVLEAAAKGAPERVAAALSLARAELLLLRRQDGDLAAAERLVRKVLSLRPDSSRAWSILADIGQAGGKAVQAEAAYRKALALNATNADAANNLAWMLSLSGKPSEAIGLARRATALAPSNPNCQDTLGEACQRAGRLRAAHQAFARYVQLVPNDARGHYKLGRVTAQLKQPNDTKQAYQKALDQDLKTPSLTPEQRQQIRRWLAANAQSYRQP